ncbi:MAG: exodeoxyribonuclease VII large subunit [Acidobacteriota bacterium]
MSLLNLLTEETRAVTVGELTAQIALLLENEYFDIWVEGEVSNFKRHSSGHWYFTLKDERAQLRCAAFRNHNLYIRFRPADGIKVRVRGYISVYEPRGEYQLMVNSIEPVGKGALQLAYEQLKERLLAEGLFDEARKRPLPRLPKRVGVVTSPTGAAIRDILQVIGRRNQTVNVLIYPARVQGDGAADEIASGINYLSTQQGVDVLIVGRGGGSIEDLWAFNEESVARAIFASRVPVISAVGHEVDVTIADFVADCRAPTPSVAAELVTMHKDELSGLLTGYRDALVNAFQYQLLARRSQLVTLRTSRGFDNTVDLLRRHQQRVESLNRRLETSLKARLQDRREDLSTAVLRLAEGDVKSLLLVGRNRLQALEARMNGALADNLAQVGERFRLNVGKLQALSPLAVLSRGYALVRDTHGQLVKQATQVANGEQLQVRLAEGEITCVKLADL